MMIHLGKHKDSFNPSVIANKSVMLHQGERCPLLSRMLLFTSFIALAASCQASHMWYDSTDGTSRHAENLHRIRHKHPNVFLNQFAVKLRSGNERIAAALATKYGFVFKGKIADLENWFMFEDKKMFKRALTSRHHYPSRSLKSDRYVKIVERQKVLRRVKRNPKMPNDPAWERMWYMHCGGVNNSDCPSSMRISDAWRSGYTGKGIVVTILDDGLEVDHPDLRTNYDANASYDMNNLDVDPTPRYDHSNENKHGTRCAGVVAAVSDNNICSVGIAYNAKIGGIRMLDGEVTDNIEARSLRYSIQHIDIYSASWGPDDDGNTVEGPGYLAKEAFKAGAMGGRGGKGSIFVWASGNGGHNKDTCSCDGYINSIYTIGISSVSQNGKRPWYLESCASTLATTYSSGELDEGKIVTTDLHGLCTYGHTGTSASAPMAAGVIALMLDANQNLTWRDVQHVIVRTSNPSGLQADDWTVNGAGYNVSHVFGFGLMDAARLTHVARKWKTVPGQKLCPTPPSKTIEMIRENSPLYLSIDTRACHDKGNEISYLEHVILRITLAHGRRGDLQIFLTSPVGTRSNILERRSLDRSNAGFEGWDFMTTHHWGENPQGLWTLEILDTPHRYRDRTITNELRSWQLLFYGTRDNPQPDFSYDSCDAFPQDQCHSECNGCCGPTEMECRLCRHVSTFAGTCIASCPSGHFPHPHSKICQPCWKTCRECSAAFEWNCTACAQGFTLMYGRCIRQCTNGHFLNSVTRRCTKCLEPCLTCEGRSHLCTSCRPGFEFVKKTCEPSCPRGTFLLSYRDGCQLCHLTCEECTGSSQTQCTSCKNNMVLHKKRCVSECPRKYYLDNTKHSCRLCHISCKTCNGPSSSDCTSCVTGQLLRDGECSRPCRDEYPGSFRNYPCLMLIQLNLCSLFRSLCCHTCSQYETGNLFQPPDDYDNTFHYDDNYTSVGGSYDFGYGEDVYDAEDLTVEEAYLLDSEPPVDNETSARQESNVGEESQVNSMKELGSSDDGNREDVIRRVYDHSHQVGGSSGTTSRLKDTSEHEDE